MKDKEYHVQAKDYFPLLQTLANYFPDWTVETWLKKWDRYDRVNDIGKLMILLEENKLVERKTVPLIGLPERNIKIAKYRITPLGLDILNGLRTQKTNDLLFKLSILVFVLGILQLVL